jgi:ribosomal-protein-alanine N-acetyltransferase
MNELTIRKADLSDLKNLITLENKCFETDRIPVRNFRYLLKSHSSTILLIENTDSLLGAAILLERSTTQKVRIYSFAIDHEHRNKGLAHRLHDACVNFAVQQHCSALTLEVRIDNAPALAFYHKQGYQLIKELSAYYADGMSAACMEKILRG